MSLKWSGALTEGEAEWSAMVAVAGGLGEPPASSPSEGNYPVQELRIKSGVWGLREENTCAQCSLGVPFTPAKLPFTHSSQIKVSHADTNFGQR